MAAGFFFKRSFSSFFFSTVLSDLAQNLFRFFFIVFIASFTPAMPALERQVILMLSVVVFFFPFLALSGVAGKIVDTFPRAYLFRIVRALFLLLSGAIVLAFFYELSYFLLFLIFAYGALCAFSFPLRYALLADLTPKKDIVKANTILEASTFITLMIGFIGIILLPATPFGLYFFASSFMVVSLFSMTFALRLPQSAHATHPPFPSLLRPFRDGFDVLRTVKKQAFAPSYILLISWSVFLGLFAFLHLPRFAETGQTLSMLFSYSALYLFLSFISGLFLAALAVYLYSRKKPIHSWFAPFSSFFLFLVLLNLTLTVSVNASVSWFAAHFFLLAFFVTLAALPLNILLQTDTPASDRGKIFSARNIMMAFTICLFVSFAFSLYALTTSFKTLSLIFTIFQFLIMICSLPLLPDNVLRSAARKLCILIYRIKVQGLQNYQKAPKKALIIANHTSYLDAVLLALFLPDKPTFVLNTRMAEKWWVKPFLRFVTTVQVDPYNPMIVRDLIALVNSNKRVVIFPEGRVTVTGSLMKVYDGTGLIADKTGASIIPVQISGAQFSIFSRFGRKLKKRPSSNIHLRIFPAQKVNVPAEIKGKQRRHLASDQIFDIMDEMLFQSRSIHRTLLDQYLETMAFVGSDYQIVDDPDRKPLTYRQLLLRSFVVSSLMKPHAPAGKYVGLLLPNLKVNVVAFFATHILGAVPAMLNYSIGAANLRSCIRAAQIQTVFTARKFIDKGELHHLIQALEEEGVQIYYLEDFASKATLGVKLKAVLASRMPRKFITKVKPEEPAVVLFTSGSEGVPKGVVLSHINIMANVNQIEGRIDLTPADSLFTALPMFHSFGLTIGVLFPIVAGVRVFIYPSPLHYRVVPELIYDINSTIMIATDTFLYGYARTAHPYDFFSMRYMFAGGERIKEETFKICTEKLGVRLFEGYGATEACPLISINTPLYNRRGTVGRFIAGMDHKLEEVPGIQTGKRLYVKGPNVMLGYLKIDKPGVIQPLSDGWHDTGDVVNVSIDGFLSITGRAKRFAKVGGEMVSLLAVEEAILSAFPGEPVAVISVPDPKKGEQLLLALTPARKDLTRELISAAFKENHISELFIPRYIKVMEALPVMGTGKVDYIKLQEIVKEEQL